MSVPKMLEGQRKVELAGAEAELAACRRSLEPASAR